MTGTEQRRASEERGDPSRSVPPPILIKRNAESGACDIRIATRLAKTVMHRSPGIDLATSLHISAAAGSITLSSEDHAEGMAAAGEKRPTRYLGV